MYFSEIKKLLFSLILLLAAVFVVPSVLSAQVYSSGSYSVLNPVIDSGFQSSSSASFGLGQSLSQIAIGQSFSASFQLWSGFQYFFDADENVLTATADDSEVDLSWTVPTTYLGVNIAGYEVGTGTTSGSYTFEDVGNTTLFTKSGLTNGTTYYFIVKAYAPGGTFIVFSNEANAAPAGAVTPPPSGGGGAGQNYGQVVVSGTAYPSAVVNVLRNSVIVGTTTADSNGQFSVQLTNQPSGSQTYSIYAVDVAGNRSPSLSVEQSVAANVSTNVSNILLPPTIVQSHLAVARGTSANFFGYTAPNVPVTIFFTGQQNFTAQVVSNANGYYFYTLNTQNRSTGQYVVYSSAIVNGVNTPNSFALNFIIGDETITPPAPGQCQRSDLNCDGQVDLIDFSILLYFWDLNDISANPRVDIDKNGDVGLRDLSIMLYDWTG